MASIGTSNSVNSIDFYSDDLKGQLVALKPLTDHTEVIRGTKWGDRSALRVLAIQVEGNGEFTELGSTLIFWEVVNRVILDNLRLGNDWTVGVPEVMPQKMDSTRTTTVLEEPSPDQLIDAIAAVEAYEASA